MIKRHQIENIVPLLISIISLFLMVNYYSYSLFYFLGLLFSLSGIVIWWAGKITLGDNFYDVLAVPNAKRLVTKGIYSKLSHPIYLGMLLTSIGWSLIINVLVLYFVVLGIDIFLMVKMQLENKFLLKKFGKEYLKYKKRCWL